MKKLLITVLALASTAAFSQGYSQVEVEDLTHKEKCEIGFKACMKRSMSNVNMPMPTPTDTAEDRENMKTAIGIQMTACKLAKKVCLQPAM